MDRIAVFVDAGYLFAQGSAALVGSKKPRDALALDAPRIIAELRSLASDKAPECKLLRIYWYDGAVGGAQLTTNQAQLAELDDVKLRLGLVNRAGEQKGVDSLIVTDLIELARLNSIAEAVLLSGDEDVRVGVQIAQNYGVRVHLLGIVPSRGSQSRQLIREADTCSEWSAETIESFLSVRAISPTPLEYPAQSPAIAVPAPPAADTGPLETIERSVQIFVAALSATDIQGILAYWKTERGIPADFDRKLLPSCGTALGRNLEPNEIQHMRSCFRRLVKDHPA